VKPSLKRCSTAKVMTVTILSMSEDAKLAHGQA
jgi:hypothetical protein